jgi:hypothetical protein
MAISPEKLAHFELIGPDGVLREMADRQHGLATDSPLWIEASMWVESEKVKRSNALETRRDAREERTLLITESALTKAEENSAASKRAALAAEKQAQWALCAAIIAVVALFFDAIKAILNF